MRLLQLNRGNFKNIGLIYAFSHCYLCDNHTKKTPETAKATTTSPTTTQPRKVVKHSTEPKRKPKKVAESVIKSSRKVTIKDVNNNSKTMKRSSSESLEVVVTKTKPKWQTCFKTGCGLHASTLKRNDVGKHLTLVFVTWTEMSSEERMFYNQSLISLEMALDLKTHDKLL